MSHDANASLLRASDALLDQLAGFVDGLSDECYAGPASCASGATIGQHTRHTLDHFNALLLKSGGGAVVYDRRDRGTSVETDRAEAGRQIGELRAAIGRLAASRLGDPVRVEVLPMPGAAEVEIETTLAREVAFVTHHAVHHLAIIGMIANEFDVCCPEGFGRAPSTVAHDNA